jgi:ribosomal protein L35
LSKLKKLKIKTHSGAKRRFYIPGSGRTLRRKCHINNARRKKRGATLRLLDHKLPLPAGQRRALGRLLPYRR